MNRIMTAAALVLLTVCTARATIPPTSKLADRAAEPAAGVVQLVQKAFADASHNDTASAQAELDKAIRAEGFNDLPTDLRYRSTAGCQPDRHPERPGQEGSRNGRTGDGF
ncbi:MAG: hypothetical protein WBG22_03690 [Rhodanobacter sp.]